MTRAVLYLVGLCAMPAGVACGVAAILRGSVGLSTLAAILGIGGMILAIACEPRVVRS